MPTYTGTNDNDTLTGSGDADTFTPLLGSDIIDGLGGSDTLIVDYAHAPYDPYAGASVPGPLISTVSSNGGSFSGSITGGGAGVHFSNIENLQVTLNFWQDRFVVDAAAVALGATISVDGGNGLDTLQIDLSALASVSLVVDASGLATSFGTFLRFENFEMNLTEGADSVTTGAGSDILTGNGGNDVLNGGGGSDVLSGGSGSNILNGGDGDDRLISTGIDTVDGGAGFDSWSGNYGWLTADFSMIRNKAAGTATLSVGTTLAGVEQIEAIVTGSGNDVFVLGQSEAMSIDAGAGLDSLTATGNGFSGELKADGAGAFKGFLGYNRFTGIEFLSFTALDNADVISVDAAPLLSGATLSLNAAGGSDTLIIDLNAFAAISFIVGANGTVTTNVPATLLNFENFRITAGAGGDMIVTGAGNDEVRGNGGNDIIETGGGNDLLDGGTGADAMTGGIGDDIYVIDEAGDTVTEQAGEGTDEIRTSLASFSMASIAAVENLTGTSDAGQTLTGNALANHITGGAGNDYLIGRGGVDILQGRAGNDTYLVDDAAAIIFESDGWGNDIVYATVSYVLGLTLYAEIETFAVYDPSSTSAIDLTGNNRNQSIFGNAGANVLTGGGGTDTMYGLGGDDLYYVDSFDDQAIEAAGGGNDRVVTSVGYRLVPGSSVETLEAEAGHAAIRLDGNGLANTLLGNAGDNFIYGGGGADILAGRVGNDTYVVDDASAVVSELAGEGFDAVYALTSFALTADSAVEWLSGLDNNATTALSLTGSNIAQYVIGNQGANILNGLGGADYMMGLGGNDIYYVDHGGDAPIELAGGGFDTVFTEISYLLPTGREIEWFSAVSNSSTQVIDLIGNEFAQTLLGTNGANVLDGSGGADVLFGYGGNDTYYADIGTDRVVESAGGGFDALFTSTSFALEAGSEVEWLSAALASNTNALNLTGNEFGQYLLGNNGANVIDGGTGADILYGYAGADSFRFTTAPGAGNVDMITDFVSGTDKIALDDAIFTQIGGLGALNAAAFVAGTAAADASDRIVYNSATGQLFYDADGTGAGAAVLFATLQGNPAVVASDFVVI